MQVGLHVTACVHSMCKNIACVCQEGAVCSGKANVLRTRGRGVVAKANKNEQEGG